MPKRGINVHETEVMRAYKTVNDIFIEPISFIVPRKAEVFQEDIYPPTIGIKPAMSSGEWFSGKNGMPPKISMESVYAGDKEPTEVLSDYKPPKVSTPVTSPTPTQTKKDPSKPEPLPIATPRDSMGDMKKNKESMAAMADKFADKDGPAEVEESDESFEEVPKPIERPKVTATKKEDKPKEKEISRELPKAAEKLPSPTKVTSPTKPSPTIVEKTPAAEPSPTKADAPSTSVVPASSTAATSASGAAQGLKDSLQDIKEMQLRTLSMLESQQRTINKQMDHISFLSAELETLKTAFGDHRSASDKDERIRRLEIEVEELRSQL